MARERLKLSVALFLFLTQWLVGKNDGLALALAVVAREKSDRTSSQRTTMDYEYDLVIIGAGASGLFASGAAVSFGMKTLLLDQSSHGYVGGDCSNAACVPSKALRSMARMTRLNNIAYNNKNINNNQQDQNAAVAARDYVSQTVAAIRQREGISNFDNVSNLKLILVESTRFVSVDEVEIVPRCTSTSTTSIQTNSTNSEATRRRIRSRRFLVATGASPFIPNNFIRQQQQGSHQLPLYTYRDILLPESSSPAWQQFCQIHNNSSSLSSSSSGVIIIAGGGPTAVELGQSLARLFIGNNNMTVMIVAPTLLAKEDVALQRAACQILRHDGVRLCLGRKVVGVASSGDAVVLDDGSKLPNAVAMIVCVGRKPTVEGLNLDAADIAWDPDQGILVHPSSLRSCTNPRVFACGDCCSAVTGKNRKAAHAAWTGYHAIRNMALPRFLWVGSPSVHSSVPSITYSDPELASVGLTRSECLTRFGSDGFLAESVREEGSDRADMEREERFVDAGFVELRVNRRSGRILGLSACGPAAAELANEVGVAIQNGLTVRDLARSIHAYPSHGYLLYRLSLSMALSTMRGFLETLGPVCRLLGRFVGGLSATVSTLHPKRLLPWRRARCRRKRLWEGEGEESVLIRPCKALMQNNNDDAAWQSLPVSFLDYYNSGQYAERVDVDLPQSFKDWIDRRP
jgi:pyruvate/2-oxoglutarate dehydrogenase complex dihydrolipoamide dehydrogenase (E3) component